MRKVSVGVLLLVTIAACASATSKTQPSAPASPSKPDAAATQKPPAGKPQPAAPATPPAATTPAAPKAQIATAPDGTKIAFEVTGTGPALLLVHGGGQTRRSWNQLGYVDRLSKRFTVITFDMRGIGESDKPLTPDAYALDRLLADFLAVADAAKAKRFLLYGFGQGATVGRYLAARSDRVIAAVLVGTTMGPTVTGVFKDAIVGMRAKWKPVVDAHVAGKLDLAKLPANDRAAWEGGMAVTVLSLSALLDYPALEPAEIKAPTLWAVGADDSAMENVKSYEGKLAGTQVTLKVLQSVNYSDSFVKMEQVVTDVEPFLIKAAGGT
jgi:pimeloyl-ACP methyl ester carboxylesterase